MSNSHTNPVPLGAGQILQSTFRVFFRNLLRVLLVSAIPALIGIFLSLLVIGITAYFASSVRFLADAGFLRFQLYMWSGFALGLLIQLLFFCAIAGICVQIAQDTLRSKASRISRHARLVFRGLLPLVCLSAVVTVLSSLGSTIFVLPGLWLLAAFSMLIPVSVMEGTGFRGLGRSLGLTKGYRWPILGVLVLLGLSILLFYVGAFVLVALADAMFGDVGSFIAMLLSMTLYGVFYALIGIAMGLIYARLREIKEGGGAEDLAEVFS